MGYLIIFLIFLVLFLVEKTVYKLFGVEKKKISETSGKNIDRWGRAIILVIFLSILPFVIAKEIDVMKWYFIGFFVVSLGFQSILEWKFMKNSKQICHFTCFSNINYYYIL